MALLYSAYLFIFNPLSRLQAGLARVEEGDLTARVEAGADDEFGALSAGFNRMAQRLQGLYESLESKVREKTESLEAQHARLSVAVRVGSLRGARRRRSTNWPRALRSRCAARRGPMLRRCAGRTNPTSAT